jgi:ATP-dependent DNA helicase DinG
MICDPRLLSRGYGRAFRDSLPRMPVTHELADVEHFLNTCAARDETACG